MSVVIATPPVIASAGVLTRQNACVKQSYKINIRLPNSTAVEFGNNGECKIAASGLIFRF